MKKLALMFVLFILFSRYLSAQQQQRININPEDLAKRTVERLDRRLKLNQTQKIVIYNYQLNLDKERVQQFKQQEKGNVPDMGKIQRLQIETDKNIRAILKEDQQNEYDKLLQEPDQDSEMKHENKASRQERGSRKHRGGMGKVKPGM